MLDPFSNLNFLSTSIYDLVLLNVCHFHHHHHHPQGFWKFIEILVLTSWILHPRIFILPLAAMVDLDSGSRFVIIFLKGDLSNMVCDMCVYVNSNLSNIIAINECQSHVLFLRLINWLCKGHFCLQNELLQPFLLYNEAVITETVLMCEMHCSSTKFSKKNR